MMIWPVLSFTANLPLTWYRGILFDDILISCYFHKKLKFMKTVQSIPDVLFLDLFPHALGKPFVSRVVGFTRPVLFQPVKMDGQSMFMALSRDFLISSFLLFGPDITKAERINKKMAIFIVHAGKIDGLFPREIFKNRIYFDVVGKVDAEDHQTFLHPVTMVMNKLDILIRKLKLPKETKLKASEVPQLPPIPGTLPKNIRSLLMHL